MTLVGTKSGINCGALRVKTGFPNRIAKMAILPLRRVASTSGGRWTSPVACCPITIPLLFGSAPKRSERHQATVSVEPGDLALANTGCRRWSPVWV